MATSGVFTAGADGSFTGAITALAGERKGPVSHLRRDDPRQAPDYRIACGGAGLGAAWKKANKDSHAALSVRLDDLSFGAAIDAALAVMEGVYSLVWSRSNGHKAH